MAGTAGNNLRSEDGKVIRVQAKMGIYWEQGEEYCWLSNVSINEALREPIK